VRGIFLAFPRLDSSQSVPPNFLHYLEAVSLFRLTDRVAGNKRRSTQGFGPRVNNLHRPSSPGALLRTLGYHYPLYQIGVPVAHLGVSGADPRNVVWGC
jgi:hypothetical protein